MEDPTRVLRVMGHGQKKNFLLSFAFFAFFLSLSSLFSGRFVGAFGAQLMRKKSQMREAYLIIIEIRGFRNSVVEVGRRPSWRMCESGERSTEYHGCHMTALDDCND